MSDIGFALYLLGINSEGLERNRILFGNLLENFVILEIQKQLGWNKKQPQIYYLRTKDGQEIDIVLEARNSKLVAIEVKASSSFDPKDLEAIRDFQKATGDRFQRGIIFYTGQQVHKIDEKIYILPIQTLWEERIAF
jgi:predicted AAA+ superfamily ATPase